MNVKENITAVFSYEEVMQWMKNQLKGRDLQMKGPIVINKNPDPPEPGAFTLECKAVMLPKKVTR